MENGMKSRMTRWSALFTALGWICIVGGAVAAVFTMGATLPVVLVGISLLFTAAALDWMDGVLEHLHAIRKNQNEIIANLNGIGRQLPQEKQQGGAQEERRWRTASGADIVNAFIRDGKSE